MTIFLFQSLCDFDCLSDILKWVVSWLESFKTSLLTFLIFEVSANISQLMILTLALKFRHRLKLSRHAPKEFCSADLHLDFYPSRLVARVYFIPLNALLMLCSRVTWYASLVYVNPTFDDPKPSSTRYRRDFNKKFPSVSIWTRFNGAFPARF